MASPAGFRPSGSLGSQDLFRCSMSREEVDRVLAFGGFPVGTKAVCSTVEHIDWVQAGWVCFTEFPFLIGFKFPFTVFVRSFLKLLRVSPCQLLPTTWKLLRCAEELAASENLEMTVGEFLGAYKVVPQRAGRITLHVRDSKHPLILGAKTGAPNWASRFFFIDRSSLGEWAERSKYLFRDSWNTTMPKDLPITKVEEGVLSRLVRLPDKRRCASALYLDQEEEASSEDTPDPSMELHSSSHTAAAPPKPSPSGSRSPSPMTDPFIIRKLRSRDPKLPPPAKTRVDEKTSLTSLKRPAESSPHIIDLDGDGPKDLLNSFKNVYSPATKKLFQHYAPSTALNHAGTSLWKAFQEVLATSDRLKAEREFSDDRDRRASAALADSAEQIKTLQTSLTSHSSKVEELEDRLQASEASLHASNRTVKMLSSEMLDMGAYYQMKARLDMMRQFNEGRQSEWDFDKELADFERCFPPDMPAPGARLLTDEAAILEDLPAPVLAEPHVAETNAADDGAEKASDALPI